jgi:hypothetical protein
MESQILDDRTLRYDIFMNWLRSLRYDDEELSTTLTKIAMNFMELREIYRTDWDANNIKWYKKGMAATKELAYVGFHEER